jgi:lactate permease
MAIIIAIFMLGFITRFFGPTRSWKEGFACWKFALLSGLAFVVPYVALAWALGPEFPSLVGSLIGLGIVISAAKNGICVPKDVWTFGSYEKWDPSWTGTIKFAGGSEFKAHMSQFRAWLPYILIGGILVVTRIPQWPFKAWLSSNFVLPFNDILGFKGISDKLQLLYLPGTVPFILVALLTVVMHGMAGGKVSKAWKDTIKKMKAPTISLIASVALVKIFQGSGGTALQNALGIAKNSMPMEMATFVSSIFGTAWPMFASFVGGLGAFITGSNTVSNMLFGQFQWDLAGQLNLSHLVISSAQVVGGAAGNMICIHNIVAVCTVVGLSNREGEILKKTFWPFILYCVIVGIIAFILIGGGYPDYTRLPVATP